MRISRLLIVSGWLLAGSVPVIAQEVHCADDESISSCSNRVIFAPVSELSAVVAKGKADTALTAGNTAAAKADQSGTASGGAQARSTITDMIPWLNMLGLLSDSDASDGTIAADLNFLLPFQDKTWTKHNSQLKWAVDVSPEPFEPLIEAIPGNVRDARKKELEEDIEDTGDSELQFTYSVVNKHFGRDFTRNERRLSALVASQLLGAPSFKAEMETSEEIKEELDTAQDAFNLAIAEFVRGLPPMATPPERPRTQMTLTELRLTPDQRASLDEIIKAALKDLAPKIVERLKGVQGFITAPGLRDLATLVRHQPQLLFSANKKFRNEIVGPESWGAKVTYERSFVSLANFFATVKKDKEKSKRDDCAEFEDKEDSSVVSYDAGKQCIEALKKYMNAHVEDMEKESRWLASVEYKEVDDWQYALPADGVAIDRPKHDRLIASAGFGRAVRRSDVKDRVDFEAAYDSNLDDDDNYKSRFVVTLTYTRRFGEMDIPFSIVYANKSEFLEGTDQQIGLHIGLKYRALEKEQ